MYDSGPVDIGSRLELFVDHHLIDELRGVELRRSQPMSFWSEVTC